MVELDMLFDRKMEAFVVIRTPYGPYDMDGMIWFIWFNLYHKLRPIIHAILSLAK